MSFGCTRFALCNLDLSINAGETVALIGPSGSGKSTAAWAIQGLLPQNAQVTGSIRLCGEEVVNAPEKTLARLRGHLVSMVPQDPVAALSPVLTIGRQMQEAAKGQPRQAIVDMLSRLGLPPEFCHRYPHQVSGGQLQRIVLGQALLCKPQILLADEPAAALDSTTRTAIIQFIKDLQCELGFALLLVTHDTQILEGWAAKIVEIGEAVSLPKVQSTNQSFPVETLRVSHLSKTYPRVKALESINLQLKTGARLVISGESGSGKSTLAKCLAGWETADSGTVEFSSRKPQLIPQNPGESLNPFWETWEVVAESLRIQGNSKPDRKKQALLWMDRVGLPNHLTSRKCGTCSGGERARLAIARALLACQCDQQTPATLIFDESFSSLDLNLRAQILNLLAQLQQHWPLAYIVMAHDEQLSQNFASQRLTMQQGRLSA